LALLLREAAVNINTFNFFLIFQTNTHFLRVLLGWAHVAGGSKAFWADRLVLQATTKTRQQLWQQQHHSSNISTCAPSAFPILSATFFSKCNYCVCATQVLGNKFFEK